MNIEVCGIGNPLMDILVYIDEEFLARNGLKKGIMHLIDEEQRSKLLSLLAGRVVEHQAGGSCPNTLTALSLLGVKTALTGKIGSDDLGTLYQKKIVQKGVKSFLKRAQGVTGTSIILITPDKERTMNTHLAACREFKKEDLPPQMVKSSNYLYFTGYMWDTENQKEATRYAVEIAKQSGTTVVFDLADPMAVERYRDDFLDLIERDADIVLANRKEAELLTGESIEHAIRTLNKLCHTAVIKNGDSDTLIGCEGQVCSVPVFKSDVKDTTGAGDNFAAGFIYGLMQCFDIELCGIAASFVAAKTIEKIGAQAPDNIRELVGQMLRERGNTQIGTVKR